MKKAIAILIAAILAVSLLAACGASSFDSSGNSGGGSSGGGDIFRSESAQMEAPAPAAPMPSSAPSADFMADGSGFDMDRNEYGSDERIVSTEASNAQTIETAIDMAEKIIYTAHADIETVDFDQTVEIVYDLIGLNGAFIESSYIGGRNYSQSYYGYQTFRSANFTLRVPKARFDAVTGNLEVLGNVTSLRTDAQNITSQFVDTESRLTSYRIQEERLLAMLEKADTVADMITIETSLSEVRYSIESLTSTLKNWQSQVDYSTLVLYIVEVERFTETTPIQQTYWQQVGAGLSSRIKGIGEFFTDLFKWLIVNMPVLIILAVIAVAVVLIIRRRIRKKRGSD